MIPLVEFSFDSDDFDGRDLYDSRRDDRLEQARIDDMRFNDALEAFLRDAQRNREMEAMQEVVNNDSITIDSAMMKAINDPKMRMDSQGRLARASGRDTIRRSGQFSRQNLLPNLPTKKRKKSKMDSKMSRALKQANKRLRKKNGQLRKGKTMKDVMRLAHRIAKKLR